MYIEEELDETVEPEYTMHEEKLPTVPPADFKHSALVGAKTVLGKVDLVPGDEADVKYIKWLEVFSRKGRTILNGTNPYSWGYIAKVYYGIFSFPVRVEMNPDIPEDVQAIVLPLLRKELLGR